MVWLLSDHSTTPYMYPHTAFERRDGLSSEEEEQRGMAKRKMLGNIRFVGGYSMCSAVAGMCPEFSVSGFNPHSRLTLLLLLPNMW